MQKKKKTLKFKGKENTDISVMTTDQLIELILDDRSLNDFNVIFYIGMNGIK